MGCAISTEKEPEKEPERIPMNNKTDTSNIFDKIILNQLPVNLLLEIISFLLIKDVVSFSRTCRQFFKVYKMIPNLHYRYWLLKYLKLIPANVNRVTIPRHFKLSADDRACDWREAMINAYNAMKELKSMISNEPRGSVNRRWKWMIQDRIEQEYRQNISDMQVAFKHSMELQNWDWELVCKVLVGLSMFPKNF